MTRNARECGPALPDLQLYLKAVIMKTTWYLVRKRRVEKWNELSTQNRVDNEYSNLLFDEPKDPASGIRSHCLTKIARKTG